MTPAESALREAAELAAIMIHQVLKDTDPLDQDHPLIVAREALVAALASHAAPAPSTIYYIVCADRGHQFVGQISMKDEHAITLVNASIIRRWGTTRGLGQLALEGRQPETVTDAFGVVHFPMTSVIFVGEAPGWRG